MNTKDLLIKLNRYIADENMPTVRTIIEEHLAASKSPAQTTVQSWYRWVWKQRETKIWFDMFIRIIGILSGLYLIFVGTTNLSDARPAVNLFEGFFFILLGCLYFSMSYKELIIMLEK